MPKEPTPDKDKIVANDNFVEWLFASPDAAPERSSSDETTEPEEWPGEFHNICLITLGDEDQ